MQRKTTAVLIAVGVILAAVAVAAVLSTSGLGGATATPDEPAAPASTAVEQPDGAGTSDPETVEQFAVAFRVAIDAGDIGFLLERLHPVIMEVYGPTTCRGFIEREILRLADYSQTGPAEGPTTRTFETPSGSVSALTFAVPIAFDFRGEHFEDTALYGPIDGVMHWFGECR